MQGVILSAGRARALILGDDGVRYVFTLEEWHGGDLEPEAGMRVDFEVRGSSGRGHLPDSRSSRHTVRSTVPAVCDRARRFSVRPVSRVVDGQRTQDEAGCAGRWRWAEPSSFWQSFAGLC